MTSSLQQYVDQIVSVITNDGRHIVGVLKGYDNLVNLVLDQSHERIYSMTAAVEQVSLGVYIIRGDNVAVIGDVDEDKDLALDLQQLRGQQLKPVVH